MRFIRRGGKVEFLSKNVQFRDRSSDSQTDGRSIVQSWDGKSEISRRHIFYVTLLVYF